MPSLNGRAAYSAAKEANKPVIEVVVEHMESVLVPCLEAGCSTLVGVGCRCAPCATANVIAWVEKKGRK